jgi:hypothetical protein
MSPAERLAELSSILATGLIRLLAQKSREKLLESGEFLLDFGDDQSGSQAVKRGPEDGK